MEHLPDVLRIYCDGLKAHDVDLVATTVADDLVFVLPDRTLDKSQFLDMLRALYAAFPDWHYEQQRMEVQGDRIAIRWRQSGTHTGTFALPRMLPVPPTGKTVQIPGHYFFYRVHGNFIVEIKPEQIPGGAPGGIFEQIGASQKATR